jgi:hypothetical protein
MDFDSKVARWKLDFIPGDFGNRVLWIPQHGCQREIRNDFFKQFQPFSGFIWDKPVMFPPGCARFSTIPVATGSPAAAITMGISRVAFLAARVSLVPEATMTSTLRRQIGDQLRQAIASPLRISVLDIARLSLNPSKIREALQESPMPERRSGG